MICNLKAITKTEHQIDDLFLNDFLKRMEERHTGSDKSELDKYLLDPYEDGKDTNFDLLVWWKVVGNKYPVF